MQVAQSTGTQKKVAGDLPGPGLGIDQVGFAGQPQVQVRVHGCQVRGQSIGSPVGGWLRCATAIVRPAAGTLT